MHLDFIISDCIGFKQPNYELLKKHCNLWRNWDDIQDSIASLRYITDYFAVNQSRIQPHAGPGHFNDPDMLLIGNYGLSVDQSKVQMAIWSILAAPLLMSTDLKHIRSEFADILLNRQIIAVNQDVLGIQGLRVRYENDIEVEAAFVLYSYSHKHIFFSFRFSHFSFVICVN